MMSWLAFLALPAALCAAAPGPSSGAPADSLATVYRSGITWDVFYERVDTRRELWQRTWTRALVPAALVARARAVGGWRILAITVPGCTDSANTLPYIARLVEQVPALELRIVDSTVGRPWLEAHRTPDGRAATPTLLLLDDDHRIRGCWIEQPVRLQAWWLDVVARGTQSQEAARKLRWYEEDDGREALREFVEVLEGAHAGQPVCPGLGG